MWFACKESSVDIQAILVDASGASSTHEEVSDEGSIKVDFSLQVGSAKKLRLEWHRKSLRCRYLGMLISVLASFGVCGVLVVQTSFLNYPERNRHKDSGVLF